MKNIIVILCLFLVSCSTNIKNINIDLKKNQLFFIWKDIHNNPEYIFKETIELKNNLEYTKFIYTKNFIFRNNFNRIY